MVHMASEAYTSDQSVHNESRTKGKQIKLDKKAKNRRHRLWVTDHLHQLKCCRYNFLRLLLSPAGNYGKIFKEIFGNLMREEKKRHWNELNILFRQPRRLIFISNSVHSTFGFIRSEPKSRSNSFVMSDFDSPTFDNWTIICWFSILFSHKLRIAKMLHSLITEKQNSHWHLVWYFIISINNSSSSLFLFLLNLISNFKNH